MLIVVQLVHHFQVRRFEWFMALVFIGVGQALGHPSDTFGLARSYDVLAAWASEPTWASLLIGTGIARVVVLFVNGVMLRRAAEIRTAFGIWSFSVCAMMGMGFYEAPVEASIAAPIFALMALFELSNIWTASLDAYDRRMERRHARIAR